MSARPQCILAFMIATNTLYNRLKDVLWTLTMRKWHAGNTLGKWRTIVTFYERTPNAWITIAWGPIHTKDARFFCCGNSAADISKSHTFKWDPLADEVLEAAWSSPTEKTSSANVPHLNVWGFDISAAEFLQQKKTCVFGVKRPLRSGRLHSVCITIYERSVNVLLKRCSNVLKRCSNVGSRKKRVWAFANNRVKPKIHWGRATVNGTVSWRT